MALDKPKYGWEGISNGGEIYWISVKFLDKFFWTNRFNSHI